MRAPRLVFAFLVFAAFATVGPSPAAAQLVNSNEYGNGTAIFTRDGDTARAFASSIEVGMGNRVNERTTLVQGLQLSGSTLFYTVEFVYSTPSNLSGGR